MSAILAFLMIGVITFINTGFLLRWSRAFVIAGPIALSIVLMLGPHVRTIAERLCTRDG
jgi:hypothetical protein